MADNTGIVKKESPHIEETVSEVQTALDQQPGREQTKESVGAQEVETQPETPEQESESQPEETQDDQQPADGPAVTPTVVQSSAVQQDEDDILTQQINGILEEDLMDMYLSMSPDKQLEFKEKGEVTASKIREIVSGAKVNAKKVFHLIRDWLKIIPGVNRFFLEQEAKLKTDKILLVTEEEKKRQQEL